LPQKYVKQPDFVLPIQAVNGKPFPVKIVNDNLPWKPDLLIQIDAGWHLDGRPNANVVAHIQTDPHVLKQFYKFPKRYSDINFCMQHFYMEDGEFYLPYAYSKKHHYPMRFDKTTDVCMIGLQYPARVQLANKLKALGLNVNMSIGVVYDEYREAYNRSRIAVTWSSLMDLPARTWESMAMKIPVVTNRVPDLHNFFVEGEHYLGFDADQEAIKQILYLLENPERAEEIAGNAYRKVISGNSYDHRVAQILETAKLI
jgi:glycosyltransferase involved in cell wall biosynthesis